MFVRRHSPGRCWICGSTENPSREHKFKASALREEFGNQPVFVSKNESGGWSSRRAQGTNSKYLKFDSTICRFCNSTVTQESDLAYDEFRILIEQEGANESAINTAFSNPEFTKGTPKYTSLFRYFAKLLGCHLAEINAPIPVHLSRFVSKKSQTNCIWLAPRPDPTYREIAQTKTQEQIKYAAHGGLVIVTKKPKLLPSRFYSTSTIGRIQFIFYYALALPELWEMRLFHGDFIRQCVREAQAAIDIPIPESELKQLGLID